MSLETCITTENLTEHVYGHFALDDFELIKRACAFAEEYYGNIVHPIGKPYIQYASEVAILLDDLVADPIAICAVMIYPPPPVVEKILDTIKVKFENEKDLVKLVEEMLHLSQYAWDIWSVPLHQNEAKERRQILQKMFLLAIDDKKSENQEQNPPIATHFQKKEKQVENLIRMFLATATDIRALIIKLVDRLHFMRLLKDLLLIEKEALHYALLARITLEIYAPLADRLGMWRLKSELEDMSFRLLEPGKYKQIARQLVSRKQEREKDIDDIISVIYDELDEYGIEANVTGRAKSVYSIYNKMLAKQLEFNQINDLLGIRIIVDSEWDCYDALEIILDYWLPRTDVYDGKAYRDWIANPKENLYQSLHTTVDITGKVVEIQIRTHKMHEIAEYGAASAHWRYKESKAYRKGKTPRMLRMKEQIWSEQLAELRRSLANKEEQESTTQMQKRLLSNWIFVITPEGHVIDSPAGATPLDFAYRIHTDLGHRYTGAKVDGRIVRLDYKLKNGQIVELITSRARTGPSPEWLVKSKDEEGNSTYVVARTHQARNKIHS